LGPLLQEAGNAPGQLARGEDVLQVMRKISRCLQANELNYENIKAAIMRSQPADKHNIPHFYKMIIHYGGGADTHFANLDRAERFAMRNHCPTTVQTDLIEALATDMKGTHQMVRLRWAILMLLSDKIDKPMRFADWKLVSASKNNNTIYREADDLMKSMDDLVENHEDIKKLPSTKLANVRYQLTSFEADVAAFVFNKKRLSCGAVTSLQNAGWRCVQQIADIAGVKVTDKFDACADKPEASAAVSQGVTDCKIRGADEDITTDLMRSLEFSAGDIVVSKKDKIDVRFRIMTFANGKVHMTNTEDNSPCEATVEDYQSGKYKKTDDRVGPTSIVDWRLQLPTNNVDYNIVVIKAAIQGAMHHTMDEHYSHWNSLDLVVKPNKCATVISLIPKGRPQQ
jgi:hypothetical protein